MSPLAALLRRLGLRDRACPQATPAPLPECLSLREWADLPIHHPVTGCMPR